MDSRTDEQLLTELRPRHAGASFAAFYVRHERALAAYFRRRVETADLAADLTAETFAQALASRHRFTPQRSGSGAAWLYGIAHHVLSRSIQKGQVEDRVRLRLRLEPTCISAEQVVVIDRLTSEPEVERALSRLPSDQRSAIRARILDESDYAAIATEMQCSPALVRKRVSRGLRTLRSHMEEARGTL